MVELSGYGGSEVTLIGQQDRSPVGRVLPDDTDVGALQVQHVVEFVFPGNPVGPVVAGSLEDGFVLVGTLGVRLRHGGHRDGLVTRGGKKDAGALLSHVDEVLEILGGIAISNWSDVVEVGSAGAKGRCRWLGFPLRVAVALVGWEVGLVGVALGLPALHAGALGGVSRSTFDMDPERDR